MDLNDIKRAKQQAAKKKEIMKGTNGGSRNQITRCQHTSAKYYAAGMCKNCYHSKGRNRLATACEHKTRKLYARGVCKACYLREYHDRVK